MNLTNAELAVHNMKQIYLNKVIWPEVDRFEDGRLIEVSWQGGNQWATISCKQGQTLKFNIPRSLSYNHITAIIQYLQGRRF